MLAAFRPEVKKKLIETGLLMPTLQMIFRSTNAHLSGPGDYLTGKAHPTVFEGTWVDALKMVELAHQIRLENIPPLVGLKVQAGQAVKEGEGVVLAEAMKMENELHAPKDGKVKSILVKVGDAVEGGQDLVVIE